MPSFCDAVFEKSWPVAIRKAMIYSRCRFGSIEIGVRSDWGASRDQVRVGEPRGQDRSWGKGYFFFQVVQNDRVDGVECIFQILFRLLKQNPEKDDKFEAIVCYCIKREED